MSCAARENNDRLRIVEHVADQGVGQRGVEEHRGAAGLENAEVGGNDLPIVLRHRHGHDLIRSGEEASNGRGNRLCPRVELGEGQRLAGVRDLQRREIGEPLSGPAEDLREPPDTLLMRNVHEVTVVKNIRQAELAGIRLREPLGRPKVPPPRHKRQHEENRDDACHKQDHDETGLNRSIVGASTT